MGYIWTIDEEDTDRRMVIKRDADNDWGDEEG
jgi:hypothetical protein